VENITRILSANGFWLRCKKLLKSANIWQSYSKNKSGPVFFDSQCSLEGHSAYQHCTRPSKYHTNFHDLWLFVHKSHKSAASVIGTDYANVHVV